MTIYLSYQKIKKVLILAIYGMMSVNCMAQKINHVNEVQQILELIQNGTENDDAIIRRVGQRLDFLRGMTDKESIHEKSALVELSTFVQYKIDPPVDEAALRSKRRLALSFNAEVPFRPDMDGKDLLYYSAGELGVPVDQIELMNYAKNSNNPLGFRLHALKAIAGQDRILPELEDDIAALTNDDLNFPADSDVGPRTGKKFYPIRNEAVKVLEKFKEEQHRSSEGKRPSKRNSIDTADPDRAIANANANHITKSSAVPKSNVGVVFIPLLGWLAIIAASSGLIWIFLKFRRSRLRRLMGSEVNKRG